MWTYKKQIVARWIFFFIGAISIAALYLLLSAEAPDGISRFHLKETATSFAVSFEFLPPHYFLLIFILMNAVLIAGCPSVLIFSALYVATGFLPAFLSTLAAQMSASILTLYYCKKRELYASLPHSVLSAKISSGASASTFAFWGRLFLSYPVRTLDLVIASMLKENERKRDTYLPTLAALSIRTFLPALWASGFIDMFIEFSIDTNQASSTFLYYSSLLTTYIALPKIPELMPCKSSVKSILTEIEKWDTGASSTVESSKPRRSKIKLGMTTRPASQASMQ